MGRDEVEAARKDKSGELFEKNVELRQEIEQAGSSVSRWCPLLAVRLQS